MKVGWILHFYDEGFTPDEMLNRHYSTVQIVEGLAKIGHEVFVFYRFSSDEIFIKNDVNYFFIKDGHAARSKPWDFLRNYNNKVTKKINELNLEVILAHNPYTFGAHRYLQKMNPSIPYYIQDHSGKSKLRYPKVWGSFLKDIDYFLFSGEGMQQPFLKANIFKPEQAKILMEASSEFKMDRGYKDYLNGVPSILWVGRLDANKDPMTILQAFKNVISSNKNAHLHMVYGTFELETKIKQFIKSSELENSITLHGRIDRKELPKYYSSADYFIAASHKEGSGYALLEAMSCGATPILSDIPAFNALTRNGSIGFLFEVGNIKKVETILNKIILNPKPNRLKVLTHFNKHFSYSKLVLKLSKILEEGIRKKKNAH